MSQQLDLTSLKKALHSLQDALAQPINEFIRDSVIQRFEYTYEISWKMMKRYLESNEGQENVDALGRKDLFRVAAEKGLIDDVEQWFAFHYARNRTSHMYEESVAVSVYQTAVKFAPCAQSLLGQLEKRNNA